MQCYSNARVMQAEPSLFFTNIVNQQLSLRQDDEVPKWSEKKQHNSMSYSLRQGVPVKGNSAAALWCFDCIRR